MENNVDEIKEKVRPLLKQAGVTRAVLFGSSARGEGEQDSDVDIVVEPPKGSKSLDLDQLATKLEQALGRNVDLLDGRHLSTWFRNRISKDAKPINLEDVGEITKKT